MTSSADTCPVFKWQFNLYLCTHYSVDATAETTRLGRLINHSKTGNCQTKLHAIDGTPHLILVASRDIKAEEELLYDYGDRSKASVLAHPWLTYWILDHRSSWCYRWTVLNMLSFFLLSIKNVFLLNGGESFNSWREYFCNCCFYHAFYIFFKNLTVADWCKLEEYFSWISSVGHCPWGGFFLWWI